MITIWLFLFVIVLGYGIYILINTNVKNEFIDIPPLVLSFFLPFMAILLAFIDIGSFLKYKNWRNWR